MNKVKIAIKSPVKNLAQRNVSIQKVKYEKNRDKLLFELRNLSGMPKIINELNPDELYKIVLKPEGATLYQDSAGNLKGVFYKDGKILQHAKFKEVKPSFVNAATAVGSQALLISIAMQLNRIEKTLQEISQELNDDRIAEIWSGIRQYNQALSIKDKGKQTRIIEHAIQTLNGGLEKSFKALQRQITQLPDPKLRPSDNWFKNKSKVAEAKLSIAEETFYSCLHGIKTLSECFVFYDEPELAHDILENSIRRLSECGIEEAAYKARLAPILEGKIPEAPWNAFIQGQSKMFSIIKNYDEQSNLKFKEIEIEFIPRELKEQV